MLLDILKGKLKVFVELVGITKLQQILRKTLSPSTVFPGTYCVTYLVLYSVT